MDASLIVKQCEDYLFPTLKFSVRERALYYHLLRRTHFEGRPAALVAILPLANAIGVAESSAREDLRNLNERGCVSIEERSRHGHLVRVLLPEQIEGVVPKGAPAAEIDLDRLDFFSGRRFLIALLAREDNRCFYCLKGIRPQSCELDHVVSRANGADHSFRNIACSCHECNTTKQAQAASDFVRVLYRKGVLSQAELEDRLAAIERLRAGQLVPERALVQSAL
jgi:5-methylcytosine-specific restriction endonuclease McrA